LALYLLAYPASVSSNPTRATESAVIDFQTRDGAGYPPPIQGRRAGGYDSSLLLRSWTSALGAQAMPIPSTPALVLFLLSPVMGELVSAFLSPLEFLHPLRLAITLVPYGCGAITAREIVIRWRKGFTSLVLLGLAFGLLFEGIVTRVLFNPNWGELELCPATDGRMALAGYWRSVSCIFRHSSASPVRS
jgi:hypothetical protein